jgi:transposase
MARPATQIILSQHERDQLVSMSRKPKIEARYALRAQIILKAAKGISGLKIAKQLGVSAGIVSKWRVRFESERCDGLLDDFRPGRPPKIDFEKLRERLLEKLDEAPPTCFAIWDGRLQRLLPAVSKIGILFVQIDPNLDDFYEKTFGFYRLILFEKHQLLFSFRGALGVFYIY